MALKLNSRRRKNSQAVHPPIHSIVDALTFRLARLVAINERAGTYYFGKSHDISLNQWRILGLVSALSTKHPQSPDAVSFEEVRSQLYMDKGQCSRTLKQLTDRGLLQTSQSSTDARVKTLKLTKRGAEKHDLVLKFTRERNEVAASALTAKECQEFLRLLEKLSVHNEALQRNAGVIQ